MTDFQQAKTEFLQQLDQNTHVFATTLAFIEQWFEFTPSAFQNGAVANGVDQNQGSCKVFALSQLLELSKEHTLRCFGEHYRDVIATPTVDNHHALRRVLAEGTGNITFAQFPLVTKA